MTVAEWIRGDDMNISGITRDLQKITTPQTDLPSKKPLSEKTIAIMNRKFIRDYNEALKRYEKSSVN